MAAPPDASQRPLAPREQGGAQSLPFHTEPGWQGGYDAAGVTKRQLGQREPNREPIRHPSREPDRHPSREPVGQSVARELISGSASVVYSQARLGLPGGWEEGLVDYSRGGIHPPGRAGEPVINTDSLMSARQLQVSAGLSMLVKSFS